MGNDPRLAKAPPFNRTRAFLYGESAFTTLRVEHGRAFFADAHRQRLLESAEWLWPGTAPQVDRLWSKLDVPGTEGTWRITLSALASGRGLGLSETPELAVDDWWSEGLPATQPLAVRTVKAAARPSEWPSFLKSGDYLSRLVAARGLQRHEIPLFHVAGQLCELMHANLLLWDGKAFHTPLAGPDVLAGLGLRRLRELGIKLVERPIALEELESFRSALAVNAVRGLVPISSIDGRATLGHPHREAIQNAFFS